LTTREGGIRGFLRHSTVYVFGNVLNRAGAFMLLPLYTRLLAVEQYGALELFWTTSSVVSSILAMGLAHATLRFYFEYDDVRERGRVVTSCILTTVFYGVPLLFLLSRVDDTVARLVFGDVRYAHGLDILYALVMMELLRQIGLAYFRAREYSGLYVAVCFLQLVLQVACNVYTVGFRKMGVYGVLWGNLASVTAGSLFVLVVVVKECGLGYDRAKMKAILAYSYPFLLTAVLGMILQNMDRVILRAVFSLQAVGLYALATKFGSLVQELLLEPFARAFGAYRFKIMNEPDVRETLARIYLYLVCAGALMGLGVSLYASDVLRIMTAPDYWEAARLVPWIALAYLIYGGATYVFQTGLLYEKRTKVLVHITIVVGLANALLDFLLIPFIGALGAALALMGKNLVETLLTRYLSQRTYPIAYPNGKALQVVGLAAALVALSHALPSLSVPLSIAAHTVLVAGLPVLLVVTGLVPRADVQQGWEVLSARWAGWRSA
jgi:O-antigen/teichoic acid export membrane protein